ncbi:PICK1 isoform 13 [Pongo abelii]|uniref:PICK1 isoform 13 n=1 Tax=Pongo abelii TaxID=9601 RepID=A0A2J8UWG6_PONAB|nr:PICK1 isoform 8 [Pongo abelii]PNJ49597.1 PICK1 isoform 13 [Pongo abelii]
MFADLDYDIEEDKLYLTTLQRPWTAQWQLAMRSPVSMAGQSKGKLRWRWRR